MFFFFWVCCWGQACNSNIAYSPTRKFTSKDPGPIRDVVSGILCGMAALQVGDDVHARGADCPRVSAARTRGACGLGELGILALRQRNYDIAAQRLEKARDLAPQNDQVYSLLGVLESQRGDSARAIADLRKAVELNPHNLRAMYQLAEETERQGGENSAAEVPEHQCNRFLRRNLNNLAALLELSRISAKRGDAGVL